MSRHAELETIAALRRLGTWATAVKVRAETIADELDPDRCGLGHAELETIALERVDRLGKIAAELERILASEVGRKRERRRRQSQQARSREGAKR